MSIKTLFNQFFGYSEKEDYEFIIPENANNLPEENNTEKKNQAIYPTLSVNLEILKTKYNLLINSDIKIRDFSIPIQDKKFPAMLLYIDGMVDDKTITNSVLQQLLLKNSINMKEQNSSKPGRISVSHKKTPKLNIENFIYEGLIPHNSISKETDFEKVIQKVNAGFCALFVDTINTVFCVETKGFEGRTVSEPITENVVQGSQEAFVENIRTNTSLLRKIINNENLIIEEFDLGKISKTKVAICYMNYHFHL